MYRDHAGFTLIEIVIVVTIIAIIATIAISNVMSAKITANEGSCASTLRTVFTAQAQFKNQMLVDQDSNGTGEYATLGELTGAAKLRGQDYRAQPFFVGRTLDPVSNQVYACKSGYFYQIYLPKNDSEPYSDNGTSGLSVSENRLEITRQESRWFCYAWPSGLSVTGVRVFFASEFGEVLALSNVESQYSGQSNSINFDAIFIPGTHTAPRGLLNGHLAVRTTSSAIGHEKWLPPR